MINTDDSGPGSFRQALLDANANADYDVIAFNIASEPPHSISLRSALPRVTQPIMIDGTTQPGFAGLPIIEIEGSQIGTRDGLVIAGGNSTVRGLILNRFGGTSGNVVQFAALRLATRGTNVVEGCFIGLDGSGATGYFWHHSGIVIESSENRIGGTAPAMRNVISGCMWSGIELNGPAATRNRIEGNFLGPDVSGTISIGNMWGVFCAAPNNQIGGTAPGAGNVISGNRGPGLDLYSSSGTRVEGNFIGTDVSGKIALGNGSMGGYGVGINMQNTTTAIIGGTNVAARNIISGMSRHGIRLLGSATGNSILGNYIGTDSSGTEPIPNGDHGVFIEGGSNNVIGGLDPGAANIIAYNGGDGVSVGTATRTSVRGNSIFSNAGLGIDLAPDGVTLNDALDSDTGANLRQNFPVLSSATVADGILQVAGTLNSSSNKTFRIDIYASTLCDSAGLGQGERFLGTLQTISDGSGTAAFSGTFNTNVPAGHFLMATASDTNGNTSEFSQCLVVSSGVSVPRVSAIKSGDQVIVSWASSLSGFVLESVDNFTLPLSWSAVTNPPVLIAAQNTVTITLFRNQSRFYRIRKP